jgi:hypothetical protein
MACPTIRSGHLLEDRDGALWVAQLRTIARIDRARAITRFDASVGLKGPTSWCAGAEIC